MGVFVQNQSGSMVKLIIIILKLCDVNKLMDQLAVDDIYTTIIMLVRLIDPS